MHTKIDTLAEEPLKFKILTTSLVELCDCICAVEKQKLKNCGNNSCVYVNINKLEKIFKNISALVCIVCIVRIVCIVCLVRIVCIVRIVHIVCLVHIVCIVHIVHIDHEVRIVHIVRIVLIAHIVCIVFKVYKVHQ